jgi:succinate dehydrogenase / fumarate reductase cytochrome b subunit
MANLFASSIGKKLIMGLSGLFLILFIMVHLGVNLLLLFGDGSLFNRVAHFMYTNPVVGVIEALLGIGFLLHIVFSVVLALENYYARPVKYKVKNSSATTSWVSRNMLILGGLILSFLIVHIANFFWKIKFGELPYITIHGTEMHDKYDLVTQLFINYWWYDLIYVLGAIFLGLHLTHGFWSAFQTIGLDNEIWRKRWTFFAKIFAIIIALGFAIIPIYFLIISKI